MKGLASNNLSNALVSSRDQFQKDFGEFPPNPLQSRNMTASKFKIVYLSKIGKKLFDIKNTVGLIRYLYNNPKDKYALLLSENNDLNIVIEKLRSRWKNIYSAWSDAGKAVQGLLITLAMLFSPIIILGLLYLISKIILSMVDEGNEFQRLGGFFSPLPDNNKTIYINKAYIGGPDIHVDHVITHEHVHFLQNSFRVIEEDYNQDKKYIREPGLILDKDDCNKPTLYLLEKDELEARLHEVILSFYIKNRALPITLPAFYDALVLNSQLYIFLISGSLSLSFDQNYENSSALYRTRNFTIGEDIAFLISIMAGLDSRIRFVQEVLAPMYVNLLRYYGDEEASYEFGCQIPRPNLYDRLY